MFHCVLHHFTFICFSFGHSVKKCISMRKCLRFKHSAGTFATSLFVSQSAMNVFFSFVGSYQSGPQMIEPVIHNSTALVLLGSFLLTLAHGSALQLKKGAALLWLSKRC